MGDIVERLRTRAAEWLPSNASDAVLDREAADAIERLRKDVADRQEQYEMARWRVWP